MELMHTPIRGIYRDKLKTPDGSLLFDTGWVSNTIVNGCHILVAEFIRGNPKALGIQFMAVGKGLETWDRQGESPKAVQDHLESPYDQHIEADRLKFTYLDTNDEPAATPPSDRLQITAFMPAGFPISEADLREFGLFASLEGEPIMINVIRHPLIRKEPQMSLERVVRLYF